MAIGPFERVPLGRTPLRVTRLGLGTAPLGGLYAPVSDAQAADVLEYAWQLGIRYYDTAPLYGYGLSEQRVGRLLRDQDPSAWVISTKVGRRLYPRSRVEADPELDRDPQAMDPEPGGDGERRLDAYYFGVPDVRPVFDFSYDGVMRSFEDSLSRTGLDRLDILWIHDPDHHWEAAMRGAYPALASLREQGLVSAIGAGMNQAEMLARFAREGDFDAFMCAGRYTLLDQSALAELLPACESRGIAIVIAGVMNSGLLADPRPGAPFDYRPAPKAWVDRALAIRSVCERHAVPLRAAALQFVFAHPAVATLVAGVRTRAHLDDTVENLQVPIPDGLWDELRAERLIDPAAPTPHGGGTTPAPQGMRDDA